jgi:DNA-binding IclR family transcriptional regulator
LEFYDERDKALIIKEIHDTLEVNTATLFRYGEEPKARRHLKREPGPSTHRASLKLLYLGSLAEPFTELRRLRLYINELSEDAGEKAYLVVLREAVISLEFTSNL